MIQDYDLHLEKREVQKRLFSMVKTKRVITLAGPNMLSYAKIYPIQVKHLDIWENDRRTMLYQLNQLAVLRKMAGRRFTYHFGDIINAEVNKSAFYDLDFCNIIKTVVPHITKFKDCHFMLTVCLRGSSIRHTLEAFLTAVNEKALSDVHYPQYNLLKTDRNMYLYVTYTDLSPMVTIFKFH